MPNYEIKYAEEIFDYGKNIALRIDLFKDEKRIAGHAVKMPYEMFSEQKCKWMLNEWMVEYIVHLLNEGKI